MRTYSYQFEKLEIWHLAMDLSVGVYRITETFPASEKYGLSSQIRRSVNSVSANVAEGSTRFSTKDKARFFEIAFGSLIETLNHLILAWRLQMISEIQLQDLREPIEELSNKLNAYHKYILKLKK